MTAFETADQVAFFDTMYEGVRRAEEHAGHCDHHYSIAGHAVRLRIAGSAFAEKLPGKPWKCCSKTAVFIRVGLKSWLKRPKRMFRKKLSALVKTPLVRLVY